jgi:lipopolysaccharide export system protein LptC
MSTWNWLLLLFGCVAIALLLSETDQPTTKEPSTEVLFSEVPDLYMEDAIITQYQGDGTLKYELASTQIRHFEDRNLTRMITPDFQMHQTDNPPWTARADEGEIRYQTTPEDIEEEVVYLRDNVFLEQVRGERFINLRSDDLYIYPDRRYAQTDQAVTIDTNAGRTKAVGLAADLEGSVLKLASNETQRVHTIVLPFQFKP